MTSTPPNIDFSNSILERQRGASRKEALKFEVGDCMELGRQNLAGTGAVLCHWWKKKKDLACNQKDGVYWRRIFYTQYMNGVNEKLKKR